MIPRFLFFASLVLVSGCVPNQESVKPASTAFSESVNAVIWVHHFRNTASIDFDVVDLESGKTYRLGSLQNGNWLRPEISSIATKLPTGSEFKLRYEFVSSSSAITKRCSGSAPMRLEEGVNYEIEFINWLPREALFANFTCEIKWLKIGTNGERIFVGHHK